MDDLLNLIFDFRSKVESALYIDDEIRNEAAAMLNFLEEELVSNITGIDKTAIDAVWRSFRKLHGSLNAAIKKRLNVIGESLNMAEVNDSSNKKNGGIIAILF